MSPQLKYGHERKETTYASNFIKPNSKLAADISQASGIMNITDDFKLLGFRKKPH